jgi:hypothetical protein
VSAEAALGKAGGIISEVIKAVQEDERPPTVTSYQAWLRSMLIQLGDVGRMLTYDQEPDPQSMNLRSSLIGLAQIAYEWALEIQGKGILGLGPAWKINAEVHRAHEKHGSKSLLGDDSTTLERFAALAEECGEAADLQAPDMRLKELIQVCSVCVSWIAWLDVQPAPGPAMIEVRDIRPDGAVLNSAVGPETMGIVFDYEPGFLPSGPFERQQRILPDGEWETIRKFSEPEPDEIVSAEIHGYCPCCADFHPAGTDRALVMAQNLAREVVAISKRPGSYEVKVYADADSARPGHHHIRYTWLWFPPGGGAGRHPGPGGAGGIDEPGSGLGGQGSSALIVTPGRAYTATVGAKPGERGWTVSQGGGSNPARRLEKPPSTPWNQVRAAQEYIRETYGSQPESDGAAITDGVINAGHAPERMLPPAINVTEGTVREAVGQAIGAASMTWGRPRKKAVFQEQVANQIATELLEFIVAYADTEDVPQVVPATVHAVMRASVLGPVRIEAVYASAEKAYQEAGSSSYLVVQKFEVQP